MITIILMMIMKKTMIEDIEERYYQIIQLPLTLGHYTELLLNRRSYICPSPGSILGVVLS